jgi:ankyrin repeat protein
MHKIISAILNNDPLEVERILAGDPLAANATLGGGRSAVMVALLNGLNSIAGLLVDAGAELSIHDASASGRLETVARMLIQSPKLVYAPSEDGFLPHHLAALFGHARVLGLLLHYGADANAKTKSHERASHFAAHGGHVDALAALVDVGAVLGLQRLDGRNEMHLAVLGQHPAMVAALARHGVRFVRDGHGVSPVDLLEANAPDSLITVVRALASEQSSGSQDS